MTPYTGNWSDYMQKRREIQTVKTEKPKPVQDRPKEKKLKFSFKEEREFATIDDDIAKLEAAIEENQQAQEAAGADFVKLQELQNQLSDLEAQLEYKTERWMYLTELAERIEAQKK